MLETLRWMAIAAPMVLGASCATYSPKPLDPGAELAALGRRGLDDLVVERAMPGEGGAPVPIGFDPSDGLDETEVIAVALTLNPELQAKRLETGQARALLIEAGLWPNPEVGAAWRPGLGSAPGFSADCLETLEELDGENRHYFEGGGGEKFAYLPALNDSDEGIRAIEAVVRRELQGWL